MMSRARFLQSVIDSIDDSLIIISPDYRVRMMNRHAHELYLGTTPVHEPIHCYELAHDRQEPCSGTSHPCPLREVLLRGSAARVTHTHVDRRGQAFEVNLLASPLLDEEGSVIGVIETSYEHRS